MTVAPLRVGLIGHSISASRSAEMHMREAEALGLSLTYELLDAAARPGAASLSALLAEAEGRGFSGVNVTHPFKQATLPLLDEVAEAAATLGAVNTVVFRGGRRVGHNTDWSGFLDAFRLALPDVRMNEVVLLGAGGAGAAAAYALLEAGAGRLQIVETDARRAEALARRMNEAFGDLRCSPCVDLAGALARADGLVHATPTGMAEHPGLPLPADLLNQGLWVAEIVYFPLETELLRIARALGCRTADGGGMAVFQAAAAFELFTGVQPDAQRMLARFRDPRKADA